MKRLHIGIFCLVTALLTTCGGAQQEMQSIIVDSAELEAFVDDFFPTQMEALHIPGVVFIFVQDGEVLLAKGYGNADIQNEVPNPSMAASNNLFAPTGTSFFRMRSSFG